MANLMHLHPNQGWAYDGHWWHDCNVYLNSQNTAGNYSNVSVEIVVYSDSSAYSQAGTWNGQIWVNGGLVANTTSSRTVSNGGQQIAVWSGNIGHDANGNAVPHIEYYVNEPATSMAKAGADWGLTRIPLAPSIYGNSVDQIKPTSVRLGTEINNFGHGTSASTHMSYRVQGIGGYVTTADQGDASGYNYWTLAGLKPGKTYEYYSYWYNNNGDAAISGTSTFKTKGLSGMIPVIIGASM